jgi:hypothetical protein
MARPRKLSIAELRRHLEEQNAELERRFGVGLKPSDIERMLKNPDALRRAIEHTERVRGELIAGQAGFAKTRPHLIKAAERIVEKRIVKEVKSGIALVRDLTAPVAAPPPPRNPLGAGRRPDPQRDAIVEEMCAFIGCFPNFDPKNDRKHVLRHIRAKFPRPKWVRTTLRKYYDRALSTQIK